MISAAEERVVHVGYLRCMDGRYGYLVSITVKVAVSPFPFPVSLTGKVMEVKVTKFATRFVAPLRQIT